MTAERVLRWVKGRRTDTIALTVIYVTLLQAGIGIVWVTRVAAQTPEVLLDRVQQRQQTIDVRVTALEQMNLAARLAVLERSADEVAQVKMLVYGLFVTAIGSLLAQIVQVRGMKRQRRTSDD